MTETLNKALKFAVENNNVPLLQWVFTNKDTPNNLNECLFLAIERNLDEIVKIMLTKMPTEPATEEPNESKQLVPRPLKVMEGIKINMSCNTRNIDKNSQFMVTLRSDPAMALKELEKGLISLEEINHQNEEGWTALMYLARNAALIPESEKIITKLLELNADINLYEKEGYTAAHLAACSIERDSNEKTVEMLFKHPKRHKNIYTGRGHNEFSLLFLNYRKDQWNFVNNLIKDTAKHNGQLLAWVAKNNLEHAEQLLSEKRITFEWPEDSEGMSVLSSEVRKKLIKLIKKYQ